MLDVSFLFNLNEKNMNKMIFIRFSFLYADFGTVKNTIGFLYMPHMYTFPKTFVHDCQA